LWGLPPAALIAGMIGLFVKIRRYRPGNLAPAALSHEEQRRLSTLVEPGTPDH
jgi:cytochrome c-type biogenesis protein CcmH/NrfF